MSFDWQQESKEKYFHRAEEKIAAAGFGDFLHVDRSQFGVIGERAVKVYVQSVRRRGNVRKWQEARRTISGFKECPAPRKANGKKETTIFLHGYFEIAMGEERCG